MSLVRAGYGPTLPTLLGARRWRIVRALAVVAAAVIGLLLLLRPGDPVRTTFEVSGSGAPAADFKYEAPLRPAGEANTVIDRRGGVFVQSMSVGRLVLPAYRGDAGAALPLVADRLERQLAARHPGFEVVSEGRARIKNNPGYAFSWTAPLGQRRLFGRDFLLVHKDTLAPRSGFHLQLRATYAAGVSNSDDVGRTNPLKLALQSFAFDES